MAEKIKAHAAITQYGFEYGSALVERCCDYGQGAVTMEIKTPKHTINVYVTKTGKVRIFTAGKELQLPR